MFFMNANKRNNLFSAFDDIFKDSFDKRNNGLSLLTKLLRPSWLHLYKHASDTDIKRLNVTELRNNDDIIIFSSELLSKLIIK